jgi:hypothetical protein
MQIHVARGDGAAKGGADCLLGVAATVLLLRVHAMLLARSAAASLATPRRLTPHRPPHLCRRVRCVSKDAAACAAPSLRAAARSLPVEMARPLVRCAFVGGRALVRTDRVARASRRLAWQLAARTLLPPRCARSIHPRARRLRSRGGALPTVRPLARRPLRPLHHMCAHLHAPPHLHANPPRPRCRVGCASGRWSMDTHAEHAHTHAPL